MATRCARWLTPKADRAARAGEAPQFAIDLVAEATSLHRLDMAESIAVFAAGLRPAHVARARRHPVAETTHAALARPAPSARIMAPGLTAAS